MRNNNKITLTGIVVWMVCAIFFLYEFLLRTVVGTFQQPLMYDLELTSFKYSLISSTFYLVIYGLMQIPAGLLVDKFGLKKTLTFASVVCTLSVLGFACSKNYISAVTFRILMGLGSAFGFICLLVAVYDWLPNRYSAFFIGISQFIGTMGPMIAAGPLDALVENSNINWRTIFIFLGIGGLALSLLILMLVKNNTQKSNDYIILRKPEPAKKSLHRLFMRSQPWFIAIFSACVYFAIEYLSENEGKSFIGLKGFSSNFASFMLTISWLGYAIGCPILGFLSDYFQRRKCTMILSAFFCLLSTLLIIFVKSKLLLPISFFILGVGSAGQTLGFVIMAEQFKKEYLAVGLGLNNAMITTMSGINALFIGWLLDYTKAGLDLSLEHYYVSFSILIFIAFIALIISIFFIKETFCKSKVNFTLLKINN